MDHQPRLNHDNPSSLTAMPATPSLGSQDISALLAHRGRGNPPASHPSTAISNCFPGLEFDFRAVWKRILEGVDLHEADNLVLDVEPGSPAAAAGIVRGHRLRSVAGQDVFTMARGPRQAGGPPEDLDPGNLEWGNALANLFSNGGQLVACVFRPAAGGPDVTVQLRVRQIFDGIAIAVPAADPGVLTQGLCSPWQNDYRECGCYYWAASRPDFVNVEIVGGQAQGHNWMHKDRGPTTPKVYVPDASGNPGQLTYEELFRDWEHELRYLRRGQDSE